MPITPRQAMDGTVVMLGGDLGHKRWRVDGEVFTRMCMQASALQEGCLRALFSYF